MVYFSSIFDLNFFAWIFSAMFSYIAFKFHNGNYCYMNEISSLLNSLKKSILLI